MSKRISANLAMVNLKCYKCGLTSSIPLTKFSGPAGICSKCGGLENRMKPDSVEEMLLGEAYVIYTDNTENKNKTFNDFYDYVGIPMADRTDFATTAILRQAQEIIKQETK